MLYQAARQEEVSKGGLIIWFFAERSVYEEMREVFADKFPNISVRYVPMYEKELRRR